MSNAAKYRKKAAEFEQLKQIDRAIASYVKAIEESEAAGEDVDVALFNKVGDLALRQGRVPDAITYYERAVEHYATSGLFNNAIALCNKILRNAPGRANVYFTLGRICARKGLRGDATRNFLEYATRMQQDGRVDEGMRALAEVADLMPELTEVQALVEEHAARAGIALPRRRTPIRTTEAVAAPDSAPGTQSFARDQRSSDLVFLDIDYGDPRSRTPVAVPRVPTPRENRPVKGPEAQAATGPALPFLDTSERVEGLLDIPLELVGAAGDGSDEAASALPLDPRAVPPEPSVERAPEIGPLEVAALDGLEAPQVVPDAEVAPLEGFAPDVIADEEPGATESIEPPSDVTWLVPPEAEAGVEPLDDVLIEDITDPQGEHGLHAVILTETPPVVPAIPETPTGTDALDDMTVELDFIEIESIELDPFEGDDLSFELEPFETGAFGDAEFPTDAAAGAPAESSVESSVEFSDESSTEPPLLGGIETLDIVPVPELDAAIAAGAELVARAEAAEAEAAALERDAERERETEAERVAAETPAPVDVEPAVVVAANRLPHASYHIDPHDFVQSGELPPLLLADALVERGLQVAVAPIEAPVVAVDSMVDSAVDSASHPVGVDIEVSPVDGESRDAHETRDAERDDERDERKAEALLRRAIGESAALLDLDEPEPVSAPGPSAVETATEPAAQPAAQPAALPTAESDSEPDFPSAPEPDAGPVSTSVATPSSTPVVEPTPTPAAAVRVVHVTPSLPTAAVAAEAVVVATSRRDALRAAVARLPQHWLLRRRLAEALFEAGERDAALHELETAQQGLIGDGELAAAADIADELVHVSPDRVPYHQKRVELAVRLQEQDRLQLAYLDLADALVRMGEEGRARAVYARVLELDPHDDRARAALGAAAPPPPPPPRPDDQFVDLADWLRDDDEPASTRMRMREPVISGDEQADFDALLQHFKDGVARSLGDNDFEGHYDLGVAYKEMGLLDDAIAEFQKALRSRAHRLPAYEALGQCFVEQGRHQIAATVLSRALHEPGLDDDQRVGVLYLLAHSCEALQRRDEARGYFQRVYATDIQFRDVATRLAALDPATR